MSSLVAILRLTRFRDWFYFLPLPLLSVSVSPLDGIGLLMGVVLAALLLAFAYGWNNLMDAGLDRSSRKNPLAGGDAGLTAQAFRRVLFGLAAGAVLLALASPPLAAVAALVQLAGGLVYSGVGTWGGLKRVPLAGTFINLWIFAPLCLLGGDALVLSSGTWLLLAAFSFLLLQNQLLHEVQHRGEDSARGVRTTAIAFGERAALRLAAALGLAAGGVMIAVGPVALPGRGWMAALSALPVLCLSLALPGLYRGNEQTPRRLRALQRLVGGICGAALWLLTVIG